MVFWEGDPWAGIQQNADRSASEKLIFESLFIPRASGTEEVVIPCASDSDSGSVDLQLNNLEDSQKDTANDDFAGEGKDIVLFYFVLF